MVALCFFVGCSGDAGVSAPPASPRSETEPPAAPVPPDAPQTPPSAPQPEEESEIATEEEAPQPPLGASATDLTISPLDTFFGSPTNADAFAALVNQVLQQRSEAMTRCMRGEGFGFYVESPEVRAVENAQWTSSVGLRGYGAVDSIRSTIDLRTTGAAQTAHLDHQTRLGTQRAGTAARVDTRAMEA